MSFAVAKTQLNAALGAISWTIPPSAVGIINPLLRTTYGRIDTQQFIGEEAAIATDVMPYARLWIPSLNEKRATSGGDAGSYKEQRFPAHLFIYQAGLAKDWQGLADYFDAVVDATLAYFRNNSAPQGAGQITTGANDQVRGWGLHQNARVELAKQSGGAVLCTATIDVDVIMVIV